MVMEVGKSIICCLENQGRRWRNVAWVWRPENQGADLVSSDLSPNAQESGALMFKGKRRWVSQLKQREWIHLFFIFRPPKDWMMPTCMDEEGLSSSLSLLIQMLISSRYTLTDTPRSNVTPAIWASFSRVRLTHKTNHLTYVHTLFKLKWDYYIHNIYDLIFKYLLDFFLCH